MSASGFDLIDPGRDGLLGLTMDPTLPKRLRGRFMAQGVKVGPERQKGLGNPKLYEPSDPANAYLWPSDPTKMAPRGSASSWSTAFPGLRRKSGDWLPLEEAAKANEDFLERPAAEIPAAWYGGKLPGNTAAVLLPNTSHEKPGLLAYPAGGPIVSHHLGNRPPEYSRWVWDIKGDEIDPDRGAGFHTFTRVRRMPRAFCTAVPNPRQTISKPDALQPSTKFNAVMLNGTKSTGDHTGWLSTHFGSADAGLSHEINGPLRASSPKHLLAKTEDGDYRAGALDLGAYFSDGTDPYTGPLEFLRTPWEEGTKGNIVKRVELRPDGKALHGFRCGPRKVVWKWQTWDTWEPPSPITPTPTLPRPRDPVTGPEEPTLLKVWPDNSTNGDPHTTSSYEAAAPSIYGIAMPGLPDGSNRTRNLGLARSENERQWLAEIGMTPAEFHGGKHATVHVVFTAQHSNAAAVAADSPADRWPVAASQKPETRVEQETGRVLQSRLGFAPGAMVVAAGDVPRDKVYRSKIASAGTPNAHSLIVLAGATSGALPIHLGRFGIGLVKENYAHVVAGWEALLDFSRQSDEDNPDLILRQVNEEGAPASSGQLWLESALRIPEVSAPGTPASGKVAIYAKSDGLVYSKDDAGTETLMSGGSGGAGDMLAANNLSDVASDDNSIKNLITGATDRAPTLSTEVPGYNFTGAATSGGALTLQQIYDRINDLSSGTPVLTDPIPYYNTGGKKTTQQALFNLLNSLTAETSPAYNDKLALYDASASQTDAVTIANLFGEGKAVVIAYTGSGSSGKTVTLTGINRAAALIVFNQSNAGSLWVYIAVPDQATGTVTFRSMADGSIVNTVTLNAPAAGTAQVMTINNTSTNFNGSANTYRVVAVGTPT